MANSPQARKRARQNTKRRLNNMSQRSSLRSSIKRLLKLISEKDREGARTAYREAVSRIDRAAVKNLHHSNRAARLKSRLNNRLKSLESANP